MRAAPATEMGNRLLLLMRASTVTIVSGRAGVRSRYEGSNGAFCQILGGNLDGCLGSPDSSDTEAGSRSKEPRDWTKTCAWTTCFFPFTFCFISVPSSVLFSLNYFSWGRILDKVLGLFSGLNEGHPKRIPQRPLASVVCARLVCPTGRDAARCANPRFLRLLARKKRCEPLDDLHKTLDGDNVVRLYGPDGAGQGGGAFFPPSV